LEKLIVRCNRPGYNCRCNYG